MEMSQSSSVIFILDGFKWPSFGFPVENFHQIRKMDLREGDVVLNIYPKCGTHWTVYIVWEILNQGLPPPQPMDLMEQLPFVDLFGVSKFESNKESQRLVYSHVPIPYFPFKSTAKYISTVRNPFDCCVSFYHMMCNNKKFFVHGIPITFEQFFEIFLSGDVPFGDYFDHLLAWYEKRQEPNVLLLVYEEIVQDRKKCVLDVARFLGEEHLQKMKGQTLEKVLEHTSFEYMKSNLDFRAMAKDIKDLDFMRNVEFFRKGTVGDWESCFTENQKLRMKQKMEEKLRGTELLAFWMKTLTL